MKKIVTLAVALLLTISLVACGEKDNKDYEKNNTPIQNQEIEKTNDIGENENLEEENLEEENIENVEISGESGEEKISYFPVENLNKYEKVLSIRLQGNATTGYSWSGEVADEEIANITRDEYVPNEVEEGVVGAGGIQIYELTGLKEGETTMTVRYKRSWEDDAIKEITFTLNVNSDLQIAVTSEESK